MATITIKGADEIQRLLSELEPKLQRKVIRQALRKAAKPIQSAAKADAPTKTGRLRKAIKIRAAKRKKGTIGINVAIADRDFTGAKFYGAFENYGTSRGIEQRRFMNRAADSEGPRSAESAQLEIAAGIDREMK